MKSVFKMAISFLAIYMVVSLCIPAAASFWVKGAAFRYSPDYGDLGESLSEQIPYYETPRLLGPDNGLDFSIGYHFSESWGLRLDNFTAIGTADYHHKRLVDTFTFQTSTWPLILSIIYRVLSRGKLHPYLGAGIGTFPSKLKIQSNIHKGAEYTDSPIGYQVLAGTDLHFQNGLFFSGEARYISAKAKYPNYRCIEDCSTDWSGVFISIGIGYGCSCISKK